MCDLITPSIQPLNPLKVLVLCGGPSAEREVSLESGMAVASALQMRGHHVTVFDPVDGKLDRIRPQRFDVAWLALHGRFGEDGTVQMMLDRLGVPYTGSGAETSRLAMSKSATKQRLRGHGVPTPDWSDLYQGQRASDIEARINSFGYPSVIKPESQGSSLGVSILHDASELPGALAHCFQYGTKGLIETYIPGNEWTVSLIDDNALPPVEIVTAGEFYDFQAKYESEQTIYRFPSDTERELCHEMKRIARNTCRALGTRGPVRVDLRVDRFKQPWVLEVNTIPGMTPHSLLPKAAAQVGLSFDELCEVAILSALEAVTVGHRQAA